MEMNRMLNGASTMVAIKGHLKARMPSSMAAKSVSSELVHVTPDLARRWLAQNTDSNRRPSVRTIEAYAGEMKAGRWELTHQGLAFNQTGELIDGQHRLHAVIMSNMTIDMMVTTGLPLEYNSPIDQGYNRSFAHLLGKNTRWVSVVRALLMLENGLSDKGFKSTVGLLETCAERHAAAIDAVLAIAKSPRSNPSGCVAALAFAYPLDINAVSKFAKDIETGELLTKGDPAYTLRKWIAKGRHTPRETILATLGACRSAMSGETHKTIYAGVGSSERDGMSHYVWFVQRRRGAKILVGTPGQDIVPTYKTAGE